MPLLSSLWGRVEWEKGGSLLHAVFLMCAYVCLVTYAQNGEEEGGPAMEKKNSLTMLSTIIDVRIEKLYACLKCCNGHGITLSTLSSYILLTCIPKFCM